MSAAGSSSSYATPAEEEKALADEIAWLKERNEGLQKQLADLQKQHEDITSGKATAQPVLMNSLPLPASAQVAEEAAAMSYSAPVLAESADPKMRFKDGDEVTYYNMFAFAKQLLRTALRGLSWMRR